MLFMKITKKLTLVSLAILFVGCKTSKESLQLDDQCLPIIRNFFQNVQSGKYDEAIVGLLKSNSNINLEDSATNDLRQKFVNINQLSGKYVEYKVLKKRGIESDVAVYSCLVKYEIKFYRFVFVFYKAKNEVKIYKFKVDDSLDIELEESLKLYM